MGWNTEFLQNPRNWDVIAPDETSIGKKIFPMQPKSIVSRVTWKKKRPAEVPSNTEEAIEFWSKLWDNPVPFKENAEWLKEVALELENANIQDKVEIT